MFEVPASLLAWFYSLTSSYAVAIACMSAVIMAITTPLTLRSTKGMLEMQRVAPEMRRLQNEHRNDRQALNEEMMKLYQEHNVSPLSSCLPIAATFESTPNRSSRTCRTTTPSTSSRAKLTATQ